MSNCQNCNDNILNPQIGELPFCVECAEANNKCVSKFPAECVIYHINDDTPSNLPNLNIPNKTSVSTILEAIDKLIASNFNVPILSSDTKSITFTTSGPSKHNIKADVKLSSDLGNIIQIKQDGLYAGTFDLGKVKVNAADSLDYLEEQIVGDTDGVVSISTPVSEGLLKITPSINIDNLITEIRLNHLDTFNSLLTVSHVSNNNTTNIQSKLAPYVAYPYHGSLSNFDANGAGLSANGYDKVYICNGLNGTPDYRGRSPIGANVGIPGPALDSSTNPLLSNNVSITLNQKIGEFKHILVESEGAVHTHTVNDQGHYHYTVSVDGDNGYININPTQSIAWTSQHHNGNQDYDLVSNTATPTAGKTDIKSSNISINNSNGGQAHNNIQPSVGAIFIMYIP